jgi:hypothetical protein
MAAGLNGRTAETAAHARLKRLALIWAQARGHSACAVEVTLPHCGFRADVAAFRRQTGNESAVIFECKQALADLRRDNCESAVARRQIEERERRREIIERNLRIHYPTLRTGDSLFPEFQSFDFARLKHRGHSRVKRELATLQQRLRGCTKLEKLTRYRCANLFYLVIAPPLRGVEFELPLGWGLLVETGDALELVRKPVWHELAPENQVRFLARIAAAATRVINRQLAVSYEEIELARRGLS